ncbi:MAG TPA: MBOAT family protein, partial [Clostridiales bacterium]|nr:MBOAT family protein [Clostridiales bacterium]
MSFSAPAYVSLFLPLAVMLSALLRRSRVYKPWHSLLGLAFLGLSGWQQPLVFLVLVAGNVLAGRLPGHARRVVAVIWNAGAVVLSRLSLPVALPQGISYAAFQALSWHLDDEQGGAMDFAFYLLFFPKQPMGPLTRYQELAAQKPEPAHTWDDAEQGLSRFAWGLFKKVLIADQLAQVTQAVYHSPAADRSPALAVLGLVVFPLQLYMDFSGYTDMALGAARAVGFALPDNFRAPLRADSLRDFWRRWHITLGAWLRDYVYIPLGGSRQGA